MHLNEIINDSSSDEDGSDFESDTDNINVGNDSNNDTNANASVLSTPSHDGVFAREYVGNISERTPTDLKARGFKGVQEQKEK